MIRHGFILGVCVLVLGGCAQLSSRQTFPRQYTLSAPASSSPQPSRGKPDRNATLQVARIDVTPWLDGTDLHYRLDYRHDNRVAAYAQSDWLAPPATLLEPLVEDAIAGGDAWRAVTGPTGPAQTDFSLHIRLDDFSQVFTSPQQSYGALDATATLVDNRSGSTVAQRHFHIQAPAPTADAEGGVKALNQAALQFIGGLGQWLRTTVRPLHPATAPSTDR